ncbi:MAG: hypothetical protein Q4B16_08345 [Bacteroidia bacterium]|nr:hypothetical protein [Bacteroidia bacterium]
MPHRPTGAIIRPAPSSCTIALTDTAFKFTLDEVPASTTNLKLIIQASAPQSNGITRAYSKAVQIGDARTIAAEDYDIKSDYEAVHGAVSAGAPKVFFKYFYVNTATSEKSGDMFASAKLGA